MNGSRRGAGLQRGVVLVVGICLVALALGWWTKARCLEGGWQGGEQYSSLCYTDVYPLWFAERLDERATPYFDHPVEYPVLTGAQMWWAAGVVHALAVASPAAAFFHVTALIGAGAALIVLWLLVRSGVPPRRLWWWAGAPTLVVYAFMNWDLVPTALLVAGVVLHREGRDAAAGVAAGLGAAAKLFPALLVPVVVAARIAQRRPVDAITHAGAAAAAWLVVNLPVAVAATDGWMRFVELNRARGPDWDTLWLLVQRIRGTAFDVSTVNAASAALFVTGAAVIAVIAGRRRDPADWWQLLLPLLAWFLLTNKVYSPQFSLWLLPLLVWALPHAGAWVAFALADLAVFSTRFPYLGGLLGHEPAVDYEWFAAAVVVRAGVLCWVIVSSVLAPVVSSSSSSPVLSPD